MGFGIIVEVQRVEHVIVTAIVIGGIRRIRIHHRWDFALRLMAKEL
jgi:hypothetical protein